MHSANGIPNVAKSFHLSSHVRSETRNSPEVVAHSPQPVAPVRCWFEPAVKIGGVVVRLKLHYTLHQIEIYSPFGHAERTCF